MKQGWPAGNVSHLVKLLFYEEMQVLEHVKFNKMVVYLFI
jgi:hypothetical protein